jgi:hypothetical protein
MLISAPAQSILYAVITKGVGSGYRVADDWNGPPPRLQKTLKREGTLLALTTGATAGIQMLFTKVLSSTLSKRPGLAAHELVLRALVTAPALIFAEWMSRKISPKPPVEPPSLPAQNQALHFSRFNPPRVGHDSVSGVVLPEQALLFRSANFYA